MKSTELRIGNLVYNETIKEVMEVYPMMLPQIERCELAGEHNIKPIPLTEEWLLKLGFEWKIKHQGFHNGAFKIEEEYKKGYRFYIGNEKISIQYVHQLQNLYFALTGEELTLKQIKI